MARTTFVHDTDTSGLICLLKTGTYTGDGTEEKTITGVGFQPTFVWIFPHITVDTGYAGNLGDNLKFDQMSAAQARYLVGGGGFWDNHINSLDSDGFTVDDAAADHHPNQASYVYDYIALGYSGN